MVKHIPFPEVVQDNLPQAALALAQHWFKLSGSTISVRPKLRAVDIVDRPLLAAACDLYDLIAKTPQGRKTLSDFGLEPGLEQIKGEGGSGLDD